MGYSYKVKKYSIDKNVMLSMYNDGNGTLNIKLKNGNIINVHSFILQLNSLYFRNFYVLKNSKTNDIQEISFDYSDKAIEIVMKCIYGFKIDEYLNEEDSYNCILFAHYLQVDVKLIDYIDYISLKDKYIEYNDDWCENIKSFNTETILKFLRLAIFVKSSGMILTILSWCFHDITEYHKEFKNKLNLLEIETIKNLFNSANNTDKWYHQTGYKNFINLFENKD